jgi:hypothetical protein
MQVRVLAGETPLYLFLTVSDAASDAVVADAEWSVAERSIRNHRALNPNQ